MADGKAKSYSETHSVYGVYTNPQKNKYEVIFMWSSIPIWFEKP